MASSSCLADDLTCPICLTVFSDPVILLCGHSFCRECVTLSLKSGPQCPQCRAAVHAEHTQLLTNHILKSIAERVKESTRLKKKYQDDKEAASMCPEHEEKLKLFCVTDQQLACIICQDAEKHENHKFKPVKEAAASLQKELEMFVQTVSRDIEAVEGLTNTQQKEIAINLKKSEQLVAQIKKQFKEMHEFLKKKEKEIKEELKEKQEVDLKNMRKSLSAMEAALTESRKLKEKMTSVLSISDSETFLKCWAEDKTTVSAKSSFQPKGPNLQVVQSSLAFWPHESHLQFLVWKEMLQMIRARPERLIFKTESPHVVMLSGGRSLYSQYQKPYNAYNSYNSRGDYYDNQTPVQHSNVFSTSQFSSGQHYWEIYVGQRKYWELGVEGNYLVYNGSAYNIFGGNYQRTVQFAGKPETIGIYLNCSTDEVSYYNAEDMKLIHTEISQVKNTPVSAYLNTGKNSDFTNMTVCWY